MKHLFTNGTDTVIAENEADADKVYDYYSGDVTSQQWDRIPDNEPYTVLFVEVLKDEYLPEGAKIRPLEDDEGDYPMAYSITAKASAWAAAKPYCDGFLCSTEF